MISPEPTCKDCGALAKRLLTGQWTRTNKNCKNYQLLEEKKS